MRRAGLARLERAFTLMEMLVVVGIIVVLTALAIPAIGVFLDGQSLEQSGRITQSAFNEARRAAITQRSKNYLVFFREPNPDVPGQFRYGMRRYRERVGYEDEAEFLLNNIQFELEGTSGTSSTPLPTLPKSTPAGKIKGLGVIVFENLPDEGNDDIFDASRRPKDNIGWVEFRRDGTINLRNLVSKIPPDVGGQNLFDPNTLIEVNTNSFDDLSGVNTDPKVDMMLRESRKGDVDKRCFADIDPNTGRVNIRVLRVTGQ